MQLPVTEVHQGCWSGSPSTMPWRLWPWWTTTRWKTQVGVRPAGCSPAGWWQMVCMPLIVVLFFFSWTLPVHPQTVFLDRSTRQLIMGMHPGGGIWFHHSHVHRLLYDCLRLTWGMSVFLFFFLSSPQVIMLWSEISLSSANSSYLIIMLTLYVLKIVHLCPRRGLVSVPTLILPFYFSY